MSKPVLSSLLILLIAVELFAADTHWNVPKKNTTHISSNNAALFVVLTYENMFLLFIY